MLPKEKTGIGRSVVHDAQNDDRMARIIRVLADNAMLVVSGTKLATEIGSNRSEVWRLVQHLRNLGVNIAGHPTEGYRLEAVPDLLLPESIAPLVKGTIFDRHIHHFFKVGSTNVVALEAAQGGSPEGSVFLAEEQTAGKGRGGHTWHSEPSTGVYCSVVLRPEMAPVDSLVLSLAAGLAAAAAIEEVTGLKPDLRWPNDLLLVRAPSPDSCGDGAVPRPPNASSENASGAPHLPDSGRCGSTTSRKFCGVLTELSAEATRVRHVVVGVGINVNHASFPEEIESIATSLRIETGRTWSRVEVAAALLRALNREYCNIVGCPILGEAKGGSFSSSTRKNRDLDSARRDIFRRFEEHSSYARGCPVTVEEDNGYSGVTDGLDDRGFLRVRTEQGVRTVLHGGVRADHDADAANF